MQADSAGAAVQAAMERINRTWLEGRPNDILPLLHPDIVFVYPGFEGRAQGRGALVAGFVDFCGNATVHKYVESNHQADVIGDTAVVSFTYEMVYELAAVKSHATGRDLWVFNRQDGEWLAIWRTMLDVAEQPA